MKQVDQQTMEGILFTDEYQLTMSHLYYRMGLHERPAQFEHFFRDYPDYGAHKAGYCINAGLEWLLAWMEQAHFRDVDVAYLRSQRGRTGRPVFGDDFLRWLRDHGDFRGISMRAIPEGRVIHPNEPLTTVEGPLAMAQILETSLLNHLNHQILIATKAARVHDSGRGRPVLEFGLRRAQGKGANAGTRAALIGGADFTSNVGVSHVLGYSPKGTHAHSMVQIFMSLGMGELAAFRAYAEIYPDDCLLLLDTIDTLESGLPNAITVFEWLRRQGHEPVGVRLDSGDLAYLSIQVAKALDQANFPDASIVLSNDLDELIIWQILTQIGEEAPRYGVDPDHLIKRLVYGVGTRLITSVGDPALGGVYKLVAVRDNGHWLPAIKISESPEKTPNPGYKHLWRIYDNRDKATADVMSLEDEDLRTAERVVLHHPSDHTKCRSLDRASISEAELLLVEVLREGKLMIDQPGIEEIRAVRKADVGRLDLGVRRLVNPHIYHVSLTEPLWSLKQQLIVSASKQDRENASGR
jgi:nicotinate phosphoribosyltransferase